MAIKGPPRLPDWEARLSAYLAAVRAQPHVWGALDCALHGANAVEAETGVDLAAAFRGTYSDARGARAALRAYGRGTLVRTLDSHLRRVAKAMAQRGDLALHLGSVGVVTGAGDALFVGDGGAGGLVRVARREWSLAWRVGR